MLVFTFNQSKSKAFVPLAWAGYVLAGLAAETIIELGVKAGSKAILKKKADDYAAKALKDGKFDFMGTNPYRNKDGSITLSPSANDRAKMAGLISGALIGTTIGGAIGGGGGEGEEAACEPPAEYTYVKKIIYNTNTGDYPASSKFKLETFVNNLGENRWRVLDNYGGLVATGGINTFLFPSSLYADALTYNGKEYSLYIRAPYDGGKIWNLAEVVAKRELEPAYQANQALFEQLQAEIVDCGGVYYPSTMDRVYPAPLDMSSTYIMPNNSQISNKTLTINNIYPPSETEGPITWNEIEEYVNEKNINFGQVMEGNIDTYLEKGIITNNYYTIGEINNIYTDIGQTEKVEDFKPPTGDTLPVPIPDENLPVPVDPIDRTMLQVMKESYQFLADGIDNSIQSMKTVTDKSMGLINYLDTAFRWLPAEWRAMFGAAFVLGVFAHFFRR